jgi:hypothetical protein
LKTKTNYGFPVLLRQMTRETAGKLIYDYSSLGWVADFQGEASTMLVVNNIFLLFRWKSTDLWKVYDKCNLAYYVEFVYLVPS